MPPPTYSLIFEEPAPLFCPTDEQAMIEDLLGGCSDWAEPVVEVAGDGTIWASTTCCSGHPPVIWMSQDGGESFDVLRDPIRETLGIEGDFAIDRAGNVYFMDMQTAAYSGVWLTSYTAEGEHRWSVPFSYQLNDRPFLRAGADGHLYGMYSTLTTTIFIASDDGGQTWDPLRIKEFPCRLGMLGQGPEPDHLYMLDCTYNPSLWESTDGGASWSDPEPVPLPQDGLQGFRWNDHDYFVMPPVVDENGTLYVPYKHPLGGTPPAQEPPPLVSFGEEEEGIGIFVSRRAPDGTWAEPLPVGPQSGQNWYPWGAAGRAGHFSLAWYHTDDDVPNPDSEWFLMSAVATDADTPAPHFQVVTVDPRPVAVGTSLDIFGSHPGEATLGDFLQADLTPDGRLVIAYARIEGDHTQAYVVRSDGTVDLGYDVFPNGP